MTSYISQNQQSIEEFKTPFQQKLSSDNRWVVLSKIIPWDKLARIYYKAMDSKQGRPSIDARRVIGAMIIKHKLNFSDDETIQQILENAYLQYFLGYTTYEDKPVFVPSLFVEIRKRMGADRFDEMNKTIIDTAFEIKKENTNKNKPGRPSNKEKTNKSVKEKQSVGTKDSTKTKQNDKTKSGENDITHHGKILIDATVAEQSIKYPNDLELLNDARQESERFIDILYKISGLTKKPRTYRRQARAEFLSKAKKKRKSKKELRKAIGKQLGYLRRNINHIENLLDLVGSSPFPMKFKDQRKYWIIQELYRQQKQMYDEKKHRCSDRIVSISQPHVRPILRGKANKKTEFGSKLGVGLIDGYAIINTISWNAYNESSDLIEHVEDYHDHFGYYPEAVIADNIYGTQKNRKYLKSKGIRFSGKALGRPRKQTKENKEELRKEKQRRKQEYRERIPIEGKFGQGKNGYRLNYIRAKLQKTSESWISCIFFVMNIVKLSTEKINSLFYFVKMLDKLILNRFLNSFFGIMPKFYLNVN